MVNKIDLLECSLRSPTIFQNDKRWLLEDRMVHYGVHGLSVAVIVDSKVASVKNYGLKSRDGEKVTDETLFQAGSISKPVTAYAVLKLVESGVLHLDQPLNDYLKSWKIPENNFTKQQPVTLEHVLSHIAGITNHGFDGYAAGQKVPTLMQVLNGEFPANSDPVEVDVIPGTEERYSGGGYTVLQQMLIDVENCRFPKLMKNNVLTPLGMRQSSFEQPLSEDLVEKAASGYLPNGTPVKGRWHTYPEMAAAGLWTSAGEIAEFVVDIQRAMSGDEHAGISKELAERMTTPAFGKTAGLGLFMREGLSGTSGYFEHTGWDEGFCAFLVGHKASGDGAVIMTNANQPDFIDELLFGIADVYEWEGFTQPAFETLEFSQSEMLRMSQTYSYSADLTLQIFSEGNKVYAQYSGNEKVELLKVAENEYMRRNSANKITFVDKAKKVILRFINGDGTLLDIEPITNKT